MIVAGSRWLVIARSSSGHARRERSYRWLLVRCSRRDIPAGYGVIGFRELSCERDIAVGNVVGAIVQLFAVLDHRALSPRVWSILRPYGSIYPSWCGCRRLHAGVFYRQQIDRGRWSVCAYYLAYTSIYFGGFTPPARSRNFTSSWSQSSCRLRS
jgi:hypothetical protein